jgi:ectoine hydroxylase-related dioxygenase (phytanoyl-CoA dioxygenase family)
VGPAGSVLFCDSRLWHCVPDNKGDTPRVAIAVRYAPWFFDTSVVMPGSAARRRIVDGPGSQQDSAGIPRAHH